MKMIESVHINDDFYDFVKQYMDLPPWRENYEETINGYILDLLTEYGNDIIDLINEEIDELSDLQERENQNDDQQFLLELSNKIEMYEDIRDKFNVVKDNMKRDAARSAALTMMHPEIYQSTGIYKDLGTKLAKYTYATRNDEDWFDPRMEEDWIKFGGARCEEHDQKREEKIGGTRCEEHDSKIRCKAANCIYYNTKVKDSSGKNIWACKDRVRPQKKREMSPPQKKREMSPPQKIQKKISPSQVAKPASLLSRIEEIKEHLQLKKMAEDLDRAKTKELIEKTYRLSSPKISSRLPPVLPKTMGKTKGKQEEINDTQPLLKKAKKVETPQMGNDANDVLTVSQLQNCKNNEELKRKLNDIFNQISGGEVVKFSFKPVKDLSGYDTNPPPGVIPRVNQTKMYIKLKVPKEFIEGKEKTKTQYSSRIMEYYLKDESQKIVELSQSLRELGINIENINIFERTQGYFTTKRTNLGIYGYGRSYEAAPEVPDFATFDIDIAIMSIKSKELWDMCYLSPEEMRAHSYIENAIKFAGFERFGNMDDYLVTNIEFIGYFSGHSLKQLYTYWDEGDDYGSDSEDYYSDDGKYDSPEFQEEVDRMGREDVAEAKKSLKKAFEPFGVLTDQQLETHFKFDYDSGGDVMTTSFEFTDEGKKLIDQIVNMIVKEKIKVPEILKGYAKGILRKAMDFNEYYVDSGRPYYTVLIQPSWDDKNYNLMLKEKLGKKVTVKIEGKGKSGYMGSRFNRNETWKGIVLKGSDDMMFNQVMRQMEVPFGLRKQYTKRFFDSDIKRGGAPRGEKKQRISKRVSWGELDVTDVFPVPSEEPEVRAGIGDIEWNKMRGYVQVGSQKIERKKLAEDCLREILAHYKIYEEEDLEDAQVNEEDASVINACLRVTEGVYPANWEVRQILKKYKELRDEKKEKIRERLAVIKAEQEEPNILLV